MIQLVSLGNVNHDIMQMIARHVKAMFGLNVEIHPPLPDPLYAFDLKKKQYSSTMILKDIASLVDARAAKILAMTDVDLFIPMLTFVYGQAQLSGKVAVVSMARLRPEFYGLPSEKDLTVRRIRKEVSHELGHTFGLVHCTDRTCLMSLSTEILQVDMKSENFCKNCWIVLEENLKKLSAFSFQQKNQELNADC